MQHSQVCLRPAVDVCIDHRCLSQTILFLCARILNGHMTCSVIRGRRGWAAACRDPNPLSHRVWARTPHASSHRASTGSLSHMAPSQGHSLRAARSSPRGVTGRSSSSLLACPTSSSIRFSKLTTISCSTSSMDLLTSPVLIRHLNPTIHYSRCPVELDHTTC